jgi:hypothetical protein
MYFFLICIYVCMYPIYFFFLSFSSIIPHYLDLFLFHKCRVQTTSVIPHPPYLALFSFSFMQSTSDKLLTPGVPYVSDHVAYYRRMFMIMLSIQYRYLEDVVNNWMMFQMMLPIPGGCSRSCS